MPPAPSRRSTRYRPASNSPSRSPARFPDSRMGSCILRGTVRLSVDHVVQHHHVDRSAGADVVDVGAQRTGAERNPEPGDDRVGEGDPNEGEPAFVGPTSLNTTPKPRTSAGWPATWNSWSNWLLPMGANTLFNTAPAFTVVLKKSAGKSLRLLNGMAAAPSQLISRRPAGCWPVPPLAVPSHRGTRAVQDGRGRDGARGRPEAVRWRLLGARGRGRLAPRAARPPAAQIHRRTCVPGRATHEGRALGGGGRRVAPHRHAGRAGRAGLPRPHDLSRQAGRAIPGAAALSARGTVARKAAGGEARARDRATLQEITVSLASA